MSRDSRSKLPRFQSSKDAIGYFEKNSRVKLCDLQVRVFIMLFPEKWNYQFLINFHRNAEQLSLFFFSKLLAISKKSTYRLLAQTQYRGIARAIDWPVVRPTDASRSPRSKSGADSNAPTMDLRMMDLLNMYGFITCRNTIISKLDRNSTL